MRKILIFIIIITSCLNSLAQEEISSDVGKILKQARGLNDKSYTQEAFRVLDDALLKYESKTFDRYSLLNLKFELLINLSRIQEAVLVAVEKANIVTSPKQALNVARMYLKLNDSTHALEWLEISVSRGLQSYTVFEEEVFIPLKGNDNFKLLVETVKKKNGV